MDIEPAQAGGAQESKDSPSESLGKPPNVGFLGQPIGGLKRLPERAILAS